MPKDTEIAILKLLNEYLTKKKWPDSFYLYHLLGILITTYNLEDYVQKITFTPIVNPFNKNTIYANYNYVTKTLAIDLEAIITFAINDFQKHDLAETNELFYIFIRLTQITLHEIEHIKQHQRIAIGPDDIETNILTAANFYINIMAQNANYEKLLKLGFSPDTIKEVCLNYQEISHRLYRIDPTERLAEVYSLLDIYEITLKLNPHNSNLLNFLELKLLNNLLRGYNKYPIPTKEYLKKMHRLENWSKINSLKTNLPDIKALAYGLKTNPHKYAEVLNRQRELNTYLK